VTRSFEQARDRKALAREQPVKMARWPRTVRRVRRIQGVLRHRQPDLTVVLENVHDPHNIHAVLRTCDAVGVERLHLIDSPEISQADAGQSTTSAGAAKWVEIVHHTSIVECFTVLRGEGKTIFAATLAGASHPLYATDLTRPICLAFGNEMRGLSAEAIASADGELVIPMMGMVESLNISVACAVTLYEALRQRQAAGHYDVPKRPEAELEQLEAEWLER